MLAAEALESVENLFLFRCECSGADLFENSELLPKAFSACLIQGLRGGPQNNHLGRAGWKVGREVYG